VRDLVAQGQLRFLFAILKWDQKSHPVYFAHIALVVNTEQRVIYL
jgi:hypothetical protein